MNSTYVVNVNGEAKETQTMEDLDRDLERLANWDTETTHELTLEPASQWVDYADLALKAVLVIVGIAIYARL